MPFEPESHIFKDKVCTVCGVEMTMGGADGIDDVHRSTSNAQHSTWYDLSGRRVERSTFNVQHGTLKKGVYINNGKLKVVVK